MDYLSSYIGEMTQIAAEKKQMSLKAKMMKKRYEELEEKSLKILDASGQEGAKDSRLQCIVKIKAGEKKILLPKKDYEQESLKILENAGVKDPEGVWTKMTDSRIQDYAQSRKLKFTKLRK